MRNYKRDRNGRFAKTAGGGKKKASLSTRKKNYSASRGKKKAAKKQFRSTKKTTRQAAAKSIGRAYEKHGIVEYDNDRKVAGELEQISPHLSSYLYQEAEKQHGDKLKAFDSAVVRAQTKRTKQVQAAKAQYKSVAIQHKTARRNGFAS